MWKNVADGGDKAKLVLWMMMLLLLFDAGLKC